jgi:hypothetical protein
MSFLLPLLLAFAAAFVLVLAVIIHAGIVAAKATIDLYAILSFEQLLFEDLHERVKRSSSIHLKKYFNAWIFQLMAKAELYEDSMPAAYLDKQMLLKLLELMESSMEVEITNEECTLEWLDANKHRLGVIAPAELEKWYKYARAAASAPERCMREMLLEMAVFVRKLPKGRRPPRIRYPKFKSVPVAA